MVCRGCSEVRRNGLAIAWWLWVLDEYKVERLYRDAKIADIWEGTKEIENSLWPELSYNNDFSMKEKEFYVSPLRSGVLMMQIIH
jgi:hypothetical protein